MNRALLLALVLASVLASVLIGCASTPSPRDDPAAEVQAAVDPRAVPVFDGYGGGGVGWDAMIDAAAAADVVVIGEMHGHTLGLAAAAALWEDVLSRGDAAPALCLEFFDRADQALLDDYLLGVTDEEGFREAASLTDRSYPEGHRAMVEAAKAAGVPVFGSNSPRRYSTHAREESIGALEALRASQRELFDTPGGLPENAYRERFFDRFRGMMASHGGEDLTEAEIEEKIEGYFRAQSVWDATMAGTIARAISAGHRPVVQVVGQFHADHRGGLVDQIWRRRPGTRIVTVSMVEGPEMAGDDAGRADFVVDVGGE